MRNAGEIKVTANHVHRLIVQADSLSDAQRFFPELTREMFEGVRNGDLAVMPLDGRTFELVEL